MFGIILEVAGFLAGVCAVGYFIYAAVRRNTPALMAHHQTDNAHDIAARVGCTCSLHGEFPPEQMVRRADGALACPTCFAAELTATSR